MLRSLALFAALVSAPCAALRKRSRDRGGGTVFTLGDSFSSGVGIHRRIAEYDRCPDNPSELRGWCCRDYKRIAGAQYAEAATPRMQSVNVACGGSEFPGIREQFEKEMLVKPEFADNRARGFEGDVIHFTGGGNDWRSNRGEKWGVVLARCMGMPLCHTWKENEPANLDRIQADLDRFYDSLATNASKARIRAMGYPLLIRWRGGLFPCLPVPGIGPNEARWADEQMNILNDRINQSVAKVRRNHPDVDFRYVPVDDYLTEGACTRNGHVNSLELAPTLMSPMTFHPSAKGYDAYFRALRDSLK